MDWSSSSSSGGNLRTFVPVIPRPAETTSFDILFNHNFHDHQFIPGMDQMMMNKQMHAIMENNNSNHVEYGTMRSGSNSSSGQLLSHNQDQRNNSNNNKKRLTSEQLDSLERSFQEEIKLDPDRKLKLSRELGLQPRQIAVWFQNRRARWKSKQLELLYDSLKQDYDAVSREKLMLQEEVMKLKCLLTEQAASRSTFNNGINNKQVSTTAGITEVSGEETVESTSVAAALRSSNVSKHHHHQIAECNYLFNVDEYSPAAAVPSSFWGLMPAN